jgi:enamine deaminase RidA (YjgF/YER057c/UK114 family)
VTRCEDRLAALGLSLPPVSPPRAAFAKTARSGSLLFVSGHGPFRGGRVAYAGKLGREFDVAQGQAAAELVMLNVFATLADALGSLDRVRRFVKLLVFVNAVPDFVETPYVADGASDLIANVFGPEQVPHARSAIGVAALPFGEAVQIELVAEI